MKDLGPRKHANELARLEMFGLAGIGLVAVTQIATRDIVDRPLFVSLICLSVAVPQLTAAGLMFEHVTKSDEEHIGLVGILVLPMAVGVTLTIIGLAAIFWHFHWSLALAFLASSIAGAICLLRFEFPPGKKEGGSEKA